LIHPIQITLNILLKKFSNCNDLYPDAEEEMPNDLPMSKGPKALMTVYVDTDHAHDLVTRRSIPGILVTLNVYLVDGSLNAKRP
jgi:hypothetical protein